MKDHSVCVNVWSRQWPVALQTAVCEGAAGILNDRLKTTPHAYPTEDRCWATRVALVRALKEFAVPLRELLGDNVVLYGILADVDKLLQFASEYDIVYKIAGRHDYGTVLVALISIVFPKYSHDSTIYIESLQVALAEIVAVDLAKVNAIMPAVRAWVILLVGHGAQSHFMDKAGPLLQSAHA